MCGENFRERLSLLVRKGSPPRVRGKLGAVSLSSSATRITPACAGKTFQRKFRTVYKKDHPRVCGENTLKIEESLDWQGSPPRVRGKLHLAK